MWRRLRSDMRIGDQGVELPRRRRQEKRLPGRIARIFRIAICLT
jgi:hypothetical protein